MPKRGIKIIEDVPGEGPELKRGDWVRVRYDLSLNKGEVIQENQEEDFKFGDRMKIAGFNYGLERMRVGGTRVFKASPHLCYRDLEIPSIPKNAVLVFNIKHVSIVKST